MASGFETPEFFATSELLELAQEAGRIGIFEWRLPEDVVRLSDKFLALYGLTDFDGRFESWLDRVFREDKPRIAYMIKSAFAERAPEMQAEFRIRGPGPGELKWIEGRYLIFYRDDGSPSCVVGVNVDVTERKQAIVELRTFTETLEQSVRDRQRVEEALREESQTLEILNRTGAALAAELDLERLVQSVTDAGVELTGAKFGAFFYNVLNEDGGSYMLYTISGVDRSAFEKFPMPRATEIFAPTFNGERVIRSADITKDPRYGKSGPYHGMPEGHLPVRSYLAVPVTSRSGEVIGGLFFGHPETDVFSVGAERVMTGLAAQAAIAIDNARLFHAVQRANETLEERVDQRTEELDQANEALRQAQKMEAIGHLTGGIAHDFNNLLTVIRGSADLLRRRDLSEARRRRYVDAISDTADRAATLTSQLLAFARRQALKPEVFDVSIRVHGIADMLRTVLGSRIRLNLRDDCPDCYVEADVGQFETALVNMAVNARDAMGGEGDLTIAIEAAESKDGKPMVAVRVSDTGQGIEADELERIFEPFFTTKDVGKGTGLGLSQVYGFVKQSDGEIDVESKVGEGTCFIIRFPRADGSDEAEVVDNDTDGDIAHGSGRVLVVEDNAEVGKFATHLLNDLGFETSLAADAQQALEQLERQPGKFDLVFSDVVMPGMDGVEFANRVREGWPDLPVILTSGYSHILADDPAHGFPLLRKPYSVEALASVMRAARNGPPAPAN